MNLPVAACLALLLCADPDGGWVGREVMVRKTGIRATAETCSDPDKGVPLKDIRVYIVTRQTRGKLYLRGNTEEGWVVAADVFTLKDAYAEHDRRAGKDPTDDAALAMRGHVAGLMHRYPLALADLDAALRLSPRGARWWHLRGNVHFELGDLERARADLDQALKLDPRQAHALVTRAIVRSLTKDHQGAIEDCTAAIRLEPGSALAYVNRANCWSALGDLSQALADLDACLKLAPNYSLAYGNRGGVLTDLRQPQKALADFARALQIDPDNHIAWHNRGSLYFKRREYARAMENYDESYRLNPDPRTLSDRGWLWLAMNEPRNALLDLEVALLSAADNPAALYRRGMVALAMHDDEAALGYLDKSLACKSPDSSALAGRARVWEAKKEYARAAADHERATRAADPAHDAQREQARFLVTCPDARYRDGKRAVALARKAFERADDPRDAKYLGVVAAAHAEAGDFAEAVRWQERACADPLLTDTERANQTARLDRYRQKQPLHSFQD